MFYINIILSVIFSLGIIYNLYLALKRNKTINSVGKDDLFITLIMLSVCILAFPITNINSRIEIIRTILIYIFLFSTFCIKRGLNSNGVNKVLFTIPWQQINLIEISECQLSKFQIIFYTKYYKFKLIFNNIDINNTLQVLSSNHPNNIKISKQLERKIIYNRFKN